MVTAQHSFTAATITAHRDVWAALRAMPQLAAVIVGILTVYGLLEMVGHRFIPRQSLLGRDLFSIPYYVLITPYLIAVHRYIILGEVTRHYRLQWHDMRFQLFFGWAFSMFVLARLLLMMNVLPHHWMFQFIAFGIGVCACVIFTRTTILFPAIAVDAPGLTLRQAFDDTRGHGWYIFFLMLIPFIPSALVVTLVSLLLVLFRSPAVMLVMVPLLGLAVIVWLTMAVVIASRLYQWLGHRVNQQP